MWWSMNEAIRMQLSAYVDGELPDNEKELLLRRLSQDAELRHQVAEYMAIGHAIRGDVMIGGVSGVRDRVAEALGDRSAGDAPAGGAPRRRGYLRPLAGVSVAAAVALVAIIGLRQSPNVDVVAPSGEVTAETVSFPTQPAADELLRQYRLMHAAGASDNGAHSIRTRLTGFELMRGDAAASDDEPEDGSQAPQAPGE